MTVEDIELVRLFLPVALTALTLFGGAIIYGFQKSLDRKNQIMQERRELYREYVSKTQQLVMNGLLTKRDLASEEFPGYRALHFQIIVSAPDSVVNPLVAMDEKLNDLMNFQFKDNLEEGSDFLPSKVRDYRGEFQGAFDEVVAAMRRDSFSDTNVSAVLLAAARSAAVGGFFR